MDLRGSRVAGFLSVLQSMHPTLSALLNKAQIAF
jgi:hypothetical protein